MIERVVFDVDCVLNKFVQSLVKLNGLNYDEIEWIPGEYNFLKQFPDWKDVEFFKGCTQDWWVNDVEKSEWFHELFDFFKPFNLRGELCLCSAYFKLEDGTTPHIDSVVGKIKWIEKHCKGIPYLLGKEKYFLANNTTVLIDDCDDNIDTFIRKGGNGIVFPCKWNKQHKNSENPMLYVKDEFFKLNSK